MTAQQALGVLAEGGLAAALTALAFDAGGVAAVAPELRNQLAVFALERSRVQNVAHGGTISSVTPNRQAFRKPHGSAVGYSVRGASARTSMRFGRLSWVALLTCACRGPEAAPRSSLPQPRAAEPLPSAVFMPNGGWNRIELPDMALTLEVPDAQGWRAAGGRDWLRIEHPASDSSIELRRVRIAAHARPSDCASEAGLEFTTRDPSEWLEQRSLLTPAELRIDLAVGLAPAKDQMLVGSVEAAAVGSRTCVGIRIRTAVQGVGSEPEIARRLSVFADRVVPSLALLRVEDRVAVPDDIGDRRFPD